MNKNTVIGIVVLLAIVAGAAWYMNRPVEEMPGSDQEAVEPTSQGEEGEEEEAPQSVVVTLSGQNDSGMSGMATLTAMNGQTHVALTLTGAPMDVTQPAHIHSGSCADIGGVVYPITFPVNGVSETTLDVSLDAIMGQLPLALNVHKSAEEASIYVACGDLML